MKRTYLKKLTPNDKKDYFVMYKILINFHKIYIIKKKRKRNIWYENSLALYKNEVIGFLEFVFLKKINWHIGHAF